MKTSRLATLLLLEVAVSLGAAAPSRAQPSLTPLQVAYAGSMASMMDGAIKPAITKALNAELQGRAQGSTGLANLIIAGSIRPDVFICVTPAPMRKVLKAGKADSATAFARTEMVIAYSPISESAHEFARADEPGSKPWWEILAQPGIRFGRTDPHTDPQGLNILFTMQLAETYYRQPGLADKILGPQINPAQIFQEPDVMARLQSGQLDAASAYKTQPDAFALPYILLPREVNLGGASMDQYYSHASIFLKGELLHPAPLIFYAAALKDAAQPKLAAKFVAWLESAAAREILSRYHYDDPGGVKPLNP